MASPALSRGLRKGLRTLTQVIAGGALTALVNALVVKLDPTTAAIVLGAWTALVAFLMNFLETKGTIATLLPSPGLVTEGAPGAVLDTVVGTVDVVTVVAEETGAVAGDVLDVAGRTVGRVTGILGG